MSTLAGRFAPGQILDLLRAREWLLIVSVGTFLLSLGMGLIVPILPLYAQTFGVSTTLIGFLVTVFGVGRILTNMPTGRAADRWGRRMVLIVGPLITAVSSVGLAFSPNFATLMLFRFVQGLGSGMQMTGGFLAVADLSPPDERGRSASLFQGALLLGMSFGPVVGGVLTALWGFRGPFLAYAFLALLASWWAWSRFPESKGQALRQVRTAPGRVALRGWGLLRDPDFLLISLVSFTIFFTRSGGRFTILPLFGSEVLGLDPAQVGFVMTLIAFLNFLGLLPAGHLSDRFGRKRMIVPSLIVAGAAFSWMGLAGSFAALLLASLTLGLASGLGHATPAAYVADISDPHAYATTIGAFRTLGDIGLLIGPVLLGLLADQAGLRSAFQLCAVGMVASAVFFGLFARETSGPAAVVAEPVEV